MRSQAPGPPARNRDAAAAGGTLLADFSLDITSKELGELAPARAVIPASTSVQLSFPDGADLPERVSTARAIKEAGFTPVPIIAARRLRSQQMLREYLAALRAADASESVLVVAGDPVQPQGPYPDAASVIGSGLLEDHGVRQASVAGHPGGHPAVADGVLWAALAAKTAALGRRGLGGDVITQFGFDAAGSGVAHRGASAGYRPAGAGGRPRAGNRAKAAGDRVPVRRGRERVRRGRVRALAD